MRPRPRARGLSFADARAPRRAGALLRLLGVVAWIAACGQILNVDGIEVVVPTEVAAAGAGGAGQDCAPGTFRCEGAALRLCDGDTREFATVRVCSSAELCCDDPARCNRGQPGCVAPACQTGEFRCQGDVLETCNAGQTGYVQIDRCQSELHCNASLGRCTDEPCDSAQRQQQCNGSTLEECLPGRSAWEPIDECTTRGLCAPNATCEAAACRIPGTGDGSSPYICVSGNLMRCNDAQTGWEFVETCLNTVNCNPLINELVGDPYGSDMTTAQLQSLGCTTPVCSPGRYLCDGAVLRLCDANRTVYTPVDTCLTARHCDATGGRCTPAPCVVGDRQCSGDEHQVCTETGWRTLQTCESGAPCDPEAGCQAAVCRANEYRCVEDALQRCNVARTGWIPVRTCETPALCSVVSKRCEAPACAADERRCTSAGVLERCNSGRSGWEPVSDCAAGALGPLSNASALCDPSAGGRCLPSASCTTNALRCNGAELERCLDNAWHPYDHCATAAHCSVATGSCLPPACEPGSFRCVAPSDRSVAVAQDASHLGLELQVCNDSGTAFVASRTCATRELCDEVHGQCDICDPSLPFLCTGNRLQVCTADGQELTLLKVCSQECTTVEENGASRTTCREDLDVASPP